MPDYAQLVKIYGQSPESAKGRYSPAECVGAVKAPVSDNPDPKHVSTSFAERQNLNMRMHATAAGVTDKLWDVSNIVKVLEDWEAAN